MGPSVWWEVTVWTSTATEMSGLEGTRMRRTKEKGKLRRRWTSRRALQPRGRRKLHPKRRRTRRLPARKVAVGERSGRLRRRRLAVRRRRRKKTSEKEGRCVPCV